jgi:hypothetical protein
MKGVDMYLMYAGAAMGTVAFVGSVVSLIVPGHMWTNREPFFLWGYVLCGVAAALSGLGAYFVVGR